MVPIIEYRGKGNVFGANLITPVVQKREGQGYRNFKNKAEFINFVDSIRPSRRVTGYVTVKCSCGKSYEYLSKSEIPESNLICDCGRQILIYDK